MLTQAQAGNFFAAEWLTPEIFHEPGDFSLSILAFEGLAFIAFGFALTETEADFDVAVFPIHFEGDECSAFDLGFLE